MFSEWGTKKKEREENKEENLELCVSRGRRRCGIVLLPLPLMHAHAPGRFNSTFDLLWHEIYNTHTHTQWKSNSHTLSKREPFAFVVPGKDSRKLSLASVNAYTVPHPLPPSPFPPPSTTFFPYFLVSFCRIEWSKFLSGDLINILLNVRTTGTKFQNAEANQCGIAAPPVALLTACLCLLKSSTDLCKWLSICMFIEIDCYWLSTVKFE